MENRFRELRLKYKVNGKTLSQRAIAPLLGVKATHISEIESGRIPSARELACYHDFFRVSYEYLLGENDNYVTSDVFREKPLIESKIENTLRWLNETTEPDEIKLRDTIHFLLGTEKGLLLLFYLSEYINNNCNKTYWEACIEVIKNPQFNESSYATLRMLVDGIAEE